MKRIALFDLDHTLLPIDSDHSWGVFTQTIGWTDPAEFKRRNDEFFEHYGLDSTFDPKTGVFSCDLCIPVTPM